MRKTKAIAVIVSIILIVGMLASCGATVIDKPTVGDNVSLVDITGFCEMKVEGTTITVTGETNFIPGTIIHISIVAQSGMEIDSVKISKSNDKIVQTFQITEDKYGDDVKSFTAFISVAPTLYGKQIDDVYTQYGEDFQRISGDHIWNKDGNIIVFASNPHAK